MVLCKECVHVYLDTGTYYCANARTVSPVDGEAQSRRALDVRNDNTLCAPEGRWFMAATAKYSEGTETTKTGLAR